MENLDFEKEAARLDALRKLDILDTPIDNRFERVTRLLQYFLKVPIASFNLVDKERQWTKSIQGLSVVELSRDQSFCSTMIKDEENDMVINDARMDHRFAQNPLVTGAPNIVFYAGYPVRSPEGEKVGALCAIDRKPRLMSSRDMLILRDLAGVLESELRLQTLEGKVSGLEDRLESVERVAMIDPLTRLWNRAGVTRVLQKEWEECKHKGQSLSCIIADIDHFKKFNDENSRYAGDMVLQKLAKILLSMLRVEDTLGRLGNDQFMILLPDFSREQLFYLVDRLRRETLIADPDDSGPLPVTVSLGAACCMPDSSVDPSDLIRAADEAMVEAKRTGRNRSVVARSPGHTAAA